MTVYDSLGLSPIINASGPVTRLGGAPMPAGVLQAFLNAASATVPLDLLHAAASRRLAEVCCTEAGLVTAGASAALTLGTAAILSGHDPGRMEKLPHCDHFPCEFVIAREHRSGYDHAIRAAGAKFVEVGMNEIVSNAGVRRTEAWEYEAAFGPQTAGVVYVFGENSAPPLADVVARAHRHQLPVLVDAAGELPPRANLRDIPATGADLVAFSGGKAIRGPQSTGILCGRRELIASAALQMLDMDDHPELWSPPSDFIDKSKLVGMPRHGIGRALKVSKEEIIALLSALDLFVAESHPNSVSLQRRMLNEIVSSLSAAPVCCEIRDSSDGESPPILEISLEKRDGKAAFDICRRLRAGSPPIYVGHGKLGTGTLVIHPFCLKAEDVATLSRRLLEELSAKARGT